LPTAAIRDRNSRRPWRKSSPISKLKSQALRSRQRICGASTPLGRRTDDCVAEPLPTTRKGLGKPKSQGDGVFCASHQSASCSENSVIPFDAPGQTLMRTFSAFDLWLAANALCPFTEPSRRISGARDPSCGFPIAPEIRSVDRRADDGTGRSCRKLANYW
jgi:hypothetical protein